MARRVAKWRDYLMQWYKGVRTAAGATVCTTAKLFERYDLIFTPSAAARPWGRENLTPMRSSAGPRDHAVFTGCVNITGLPAGMQLVAGFSQGEQLLDLAQS